MSTNRLTQLTLLYLSFPAAIFLIGWVKWWISVPLCMVLGWAFVREVFRPDPTPDLSALSKRGLFVAALMAVGWSSLSGMGEWGYQNSDYSKHLGILSDLVYRPWPVILKYHVNGEATSRFPLVYYIAFYLPCVVLAKITTLSPSIFFFGWGALGVWIAMLWFFQIVEPRSLWPILGFPLFSGLDLLGLYVFRGGPMTLSEHWEWWNGVIQYSSNSTLLFWVPQHCICGWIAAGFLYQEIGKSRATYLGLLLVLSIFWSPFVTIGVAPFYALALLRCDRRTWFSWANAASIPLALIFITYFHANLGKMPSVWIWNSSELSWGWVRMYVWFELAEVLIPIAIAFWLRRPQGSEKAWWALVIFSLLAFPMYRMGIFNDLAMRASIPALFLLCCFIWRAVEAPLPGEIVTDFHRWVPAREALILCLCVGALTPFSEICRSVDRYTKNEPYWRSPAHSVTGLGGYSLQYLGRIDSFFFRHIARERRE